jgi:hypothetical protein
VVLQGPGDAAAQIGSRDLDDSAAWGVADQGFSGHLDQILPLHQREEAPGGGGSQGNRSAEAFRCGKREVSQNRRTTLMESRRAERQRQRQKQNQHAHAPCLPTMEQTTAWGRLSRPGAVITSTPSAR